ncbi:hypothetical protein AM588_10006082 [Phytophthora nicotianae]|uniref:diacylglycerol O-acyltransferase n=1 Tax=Phytophthora nicotianae TaxID=4792 RepID=A0A0W8DFM0_PHYNI|nr:hypothetical protein AM588_10006082 [Phytophthora nicotianae]
MYYIPLGRDMCLWMGGVDASRSTGEKVLKDGKSIVVYPGGVPEIFLTDPNSKEHVDPTQECDRFLPEETWHPSAHLLGKFWWMPKAPPKGKRYGVVYGKPIIVKHDPNPTNAEVCAVHAEYISAIERIFKQYKSQFGYDEDETLAII